MKSVQSEDNLTPQPAMAVGAFKATAADSYNTGARFFSEPLVHFFLVGIMVFGGYWFLNNEAETVDKQQIVISENDIRQIAISWMAQGRSALTKEQLQGLIDQKVAEEVLFREGVALGLDQNDEIIKRRVAQKMDFLAADVATMQEPSNEVLETWFDQHAQRFAQPPRISFRHLYFSPDKRGNAVYQDAETAFESLSGKAFDAAEAANLGDRFMMRSYYSDSMPSQMLKEFGPGFAQELFTLEPDQWSKPIRSGFGWHVVWVETLQPSYIPPFDEIKQAVSTAWIDERYTEIKRIALQEMGAKYRVVVAPFEQIDLRDINGSSKTGPLAQ